MDMLLLLLACNTVPDPPKLQPVPEAVRPDPVAPNQGLECWSQLEFDHGYGWCVFGPGGARCDQRPMSPDAELGWLTHSPVKTGDTSGQGACYVLSDSPQTIHCAWTDPERQDPSEFQASAPVEEVVVGHAQVCWRTAQGWSCSDDTDTDSAVEVTGSASAICVSTDSRTRCSGPFAYGGEPPTLDKPLRSLSMSAGTLCGTDPDGRILCIGGPPFFCMPNSPCEEKQAQGNWALRPPHPEGELVTAMGLDGVCERHDGQTSCIDRDGRSHPWPPLGQGLCALGHCCSVDPELREVRCGHFDDKRPTVEEIAGCDLARDRTRPTGH